MTLSFFKSITMLVNIPNILTLIRITLIPIFVIVFYFPVSWSNVVTTLIFGLAAATDWLDGYLARKWQQTSAFGAFLDPVADKLIVAVALVLLVQIHATPWIAIPAAIIIGREITISALREWMAELGKRANVAVSKIGKLKTSVQMFAIMLLLYQDSLFFLPIFAMGYILLYIAAVLTLWSMFMYLRVALPILLNKG